MKIPGRSAPRVTEAGPSGRSPLSRHTGLLRLLLGILAPVVFLTLLEAGLRLGHYGYPTRFFLDPDASGKCMTNYRFGWRFFPPLIARSPHPQVLAAKPEGSIRIVVLGESAAMGIPDPGFSVCRILEVLLRERYPGTHVEVVNAAMTAINSHAVREIAGDCAAQEPDVYIVYMGNNEVIGPYGPGTVFQRWSPGWRAIRAGLLVKATRTGQLLRDIAGRLGGGSGGPRRWRGLEMFQQNYVAGDDPRLKIVYSHFRRNLNDICDIARKANAGVVLSTVAVNLQDFPPLVSRHRTGLAAGQLAEWEAEYGAGIRLQAGSQWKEALARYGKAAELDDRYAELQYRMAECLLKDNRAAEALSRFALARDLDVLRFRADSRINAIVREVAREQAANGVRLADSDLTLAGESADSTGTPPEGLFHEHVHLTFEGNYRLARTLLEPVCAALSERGHAPVADAIASRQLCAQRLVLTPWDRYRMADKMVLLTSEKPFAGQMDYAARQAAARQRRDDLRKVASTAQAKEAAWQAYKTAVATSGDDWDLQFHLGQLAMDWNRPEAAVQPLQYMVYAMPLEPALRRTLGDAFAAQGQIEEAIAQYRKALELTPHDPEVRIAIGASLWRGGQVDEAIDLFRKVLAADPDHEQAHNDLGSALVSLGRLDEAILHYRKAIELKPDFAEPHQNLGAVYLQTGRPEAAMEQFRRALEIKPDYVEVQHKLGVLLARQGRTDEAIACYERGLEFENDNALLHNNLGGLLFPMGRREEAITHFRKAVEVQPDYVEARLNLGRALMLAGKGGEAIPELEKALQLQPGNTAARQMLSEIQGASEPH